MYELPSQIEGRQFDLYQLEQRLKPEGYSIGGNWDYDHGFFDYKMDETDGYQFLRLPFKAVDGQLDSRNCTVELGKPFLLSHVFQAGLDDQAEVDNNSAPFNQFQEPIEKDAKLSETSLQTGKELVLKLETLLSN